MVRAAKAHLLSQKMLLIQIFKMAKLKDFFVGIGIDAVTVGIFFLTIFLHLYLMSLHPLFKFISTTTKESIMNSPELLPADSVLYGGVAYILFLILVTLIGWLMLYVLSRTLLYNYYRHKKFTVNGFWKSMKVFLSGMVLAYIPGGIVFALLLIPFMIVLYSIAYTFSNDLVLNVFSVPQAFIYCFMMIFFGMYYYDSMQAKKIFTNYGKLLSKVKKNLKRMLIVSAYVSAAVLLVMIFQVNVLAKIGVMYNYTVHWYFVLTLMILSYLRIEGVYIIQKGKS